MISETIVELRESGLHKGNVLRVRCLKLPEMFLVNVRDLPRLNALEEVHEPVALFMPVLHTHDASEVRAQHSRDEGAVTAMSEADIAYGSNPRTGGYVASTVEEASGDRLLRPALPR